jgi:predicted deacylase
MRLRSFGQENFERGRRHRFWLEVGGPEKAEDLPVILLRGESQGKTLVVTAGVHGDEYEGVRALFELMEILDPEAMAGDLLCVPVCNPPAFYAGTRTSPIDGKNLARVFPGSPNGSLTERIAFCLDQQVISKADLYLDLHSAGVKLVMPTLIGYDSNDPRGRAAALAFGAPILWGSPYDSPGRTTYSAGVRNIPALYAEAFGGGRIRPEDLSLYRRGVLNLLRYLAILPGRPELEQVDWDLDGQGNVDESLTCQKRGFLVPKINLLDKVERGADLGVVMDLIGNPLETIRANRAGFVVLIHAFPVVKPGDPLFLITGIK